MSDLRWTDDQWALTWTAGFLRPDQEGPLPWWLSDHRNERNGSRRTDGHDAPADEGLSGGLVRMRLPIHEGVRSGVLLSAMEQAWRIWSLDNGSLWPAVLSVRLKR